MNDCPPCPPTLGIDVGGTSIKVALISDGQVRWTAKAGYCKPAAAKLLEAVREGVAGRATDVTRVGLCVPGLLDERRERVVMSTNIPALHDIMLEDLAIAATGQKPQALRIVNDAQASAWDIHVTRNLTGRLLVLALGTGVGAAVLDDGVPLKVDGDSPGHIGQIDVSLDDEPVVGPDGGAGGLEGYIGAAAMRNRFGSGATGQRRRSDDPPIRALVRAIRICHALYRPQHIVLAGGIGIRLGHLLSEMKADISKRLTQIARPGWTLSIADNDYHAAAGAARLASMPADPIKPTAMP